MKNISICLLLILITFASCQKGSSDSRQNNDYHFSFTVDGVNKSYTGYILAHKDTASGVVTFTILGANSAISFNDYLGIYIDNSPAGAHITTGPYNDNAASFTVLTTYANNSIEYEAGQSVADDAVTDNITLAHHFTANITAMDNTSIKGTFSGDYYKDGDVLHGTKLNITNGDFYVKFQ